MLMQNVSMGEVIDLSVVEGSWKTNLRVRPEKDWEKLVGRAIMDLED